MTDADGSLLTHLAKKFTNRTETLATEALGHILSHSAASRAALVDLLNGTGAEIREIERVKTEVGYRGGAIRADLVGYDADGVESVISEVKFWAKLLEGQVTGYLELFPPDQPSALLIVGPEVRREMLWAEMLRQLGTENPGEPKDANGVRCLAMPDQRWVMLTSWRVLLGRLADRGRDVSGDVRQLQALCERQDEEAFQPIHQHELGPDVARRIRGLRRLITDATQRGRTEGFLVTKKLRVTPLAHGYGRYVLIGSKSRERAGAWFGVHDGFWAEHRETPLWLECKDWGAVKSDQVRRRTRKMPPGIRGIPISLQSGADYHDVLDNVVEQLREIAHLISNRRDERPSP
ncbi:hypothetical protein [Candidatus Palauibacter sp.]|uniref:hypothetical protein n=1 Tax=Candidatus Palauibacter sp. TaxID=3101350 RepID=UPI003AF2FA74